MKGQNIELRKSELAQAVESSERAVRDAELTATEEEEEVKNLERELEEAELAAQRQEEAEREGDQVEREIGEVTGA